LVRYASDIINKKLIKPCSACRRNHPSEFSHKIRVEPNFTKTIRVEPKFGKTFQLLNWKADDDEESGES
jgi:hypothetical protein